MEVISKDFCLANLTEPYKEIYTIPFLTEDFCKSVLAEAKEIGFNTNLIKISPKAHLITNDHVNEDIEKYKHQGTTAKGIAPCYRDKYARIGSRVGDDINYEYFKDYIWDEATYLEDNTKGWIEPT